MANAKDTESSIVKLDVQNYEIIAEVASTTLARTKGLMHRMFLSENSGMLFIFPELGIHCMWMKDTNIPLSVAFLDTTGSITNFAEMVPKTLIPHCSSHASKYALEMNAGWFQAREIKVGDTIKGIPCLSDTR